jgi:hypothetical protein
VLRYQNRSGISLALLGYVHAVSGSRNEALKVIQELDEKYAKRQAYDIAAPYAGLGDDDKAFVWLEKAFQDRSSKLVELRLELKIASLRMTRAFRIW